MCTLQVKGLDTLSPRVVLVYFNLQHCALMEKTGKWWHNKYRVIWPIRYRLCLYFKFQLKSSHLLHLWQLFIPFAFSRRVSCCRHLKPLCFQRCCVLAGCFSFPLVHSIHSEKLGTGTCLPVLCWLNHNFRLFRNWRYWTFIKEYVRLFPWEIEVQVCFWMHPWTVVLQTFSKVRPSLC